MKISIPYIIIAALIFLLWMKSCNGEKTEAIKIDVPTVSGTIVKTEIKHDTIYVQNEVVKTLIKTGSKTQAEIESLVNENISLMNDFFATKDSLKQATLYADAIKIKSFSTPYEDDNIKGTMRGIVRGEVKTILLDYTTKPKPVSYIPKEVKFRLLAGVEVGNDKQLNDFSAKANIGFQNKNGAIISIGADTNERFYVGYAASIFTIKR